MKLDKAIQERYSCKKFSDKKPNWREITQCVDAMRYAPMAAKYYSLKFILIDNKEKIEKLAQASQQPFIADAPYVLAVITNPSRTIKAFPDRADKYLKQQAGAAIQTFLLKIQETGLATCWIGHFVDEMIKKELAIPDSSDIEAIFPIGYPKNKPKLSKKIELDKVMYFNTHGNMHIKTYKKFSA